MTFLLILKLSCQKETECLWSTKKAIPPFFWPLYRGGMPIGRILLEMELRRWVKRKWWCEEEEGKKPHKIFHSDLVKMLTRWPLPHRVPQPVRLAAAAGAFLKAAIDPRPSHLHRQLTQRTFI